MATNALFSRVPGAARGTEPRARSRQLASGAVYGFPVAHRASVTCLNGELWVTGPDTGDQILVAGQCLDIHGSGRVVIQALTAARFAANDCN